MIYEVLIVLVFAAMFVTAIAGVVLTRKLTRYMDSNSWTVRRWAFLTLALTQAHGIWKAIWSDHHFNLQDVIYFGLLLAVFNGLNAANCLLLKDWQRFPLFGKQRS